MRPAIAFCFDAKFLMPLAVSLRALLETWRGPALSIHLIHEVLPPGSQEKILRALPSSPHAKLHWHPAPEFRVQGLPVGLHFSKATYYRLLLPEILSEESVVLYLDSDTLALADLSPLFAAFDASCPLQACRDYIGCFGNPLAQLTNLEKFEILANAEYFNAGVLLINLSRWRAESLSEKILFFAGEHQETLFFADQSPINIVLHGRIGKLAPEWNCQLVHPKILSREWNVPYLHQHPARAKILHFTTEFKPWSAGKNLPSAQQFHAVRARIKTEL